MHSSNADALRAAMRRLSSPILPPNTKRPAMLTNLLIAIGVVVVVAFIFSPAG